MGGDHLSAHLLINTYLEEIVLKRPIVRNKLHLQSKKYIRILLSLQIGSVMNNLPSMSEGFPTNKPYKYMTLVRDDCFAVNGRSYREITLIQYDQVNNKTAITG